jgi:hypothetical protein
MGDPAYTDIGHSNPNDILWILIDFDFHSLSAGLSRTHELVWSGDVQIEDCWRGRYEVKTGYCSIVPPSSFPARRRPPQTILDTLTSKFSIFRFYFFADGVEAFSPNPRKPTDGTTW